MEKKENDGRKEESQLCNASRERVGHGRLPGSFGLGLGF